MDNSEFIKKQLLSLQEAFDRFGYIEVNTSPVKNFSVLEDFTDEELANELCRRSKLGKELE
jgi:hypothetical protein